MPNEKYVQPKDCNWQFPFGERKDLTIREEYQELLSWIKHVPGCPAQSCRDTWLIGFSEGVYD